MLFQMANVRADDAFAVDRLVGFLADNPDPGIRIRPRAEVDRAVASGLALRIESDGTIRGCSLIYKYSEPKQSAVYSEIGTMRVVSNGYGLQLFLAHIHVLQLSLDEFYASENHVFAVVKPGTASAHTLRDKAGMADWSPPDQLRYLRKQAGAAFSSEKDALLAHNVAVRLAFSNLRSWHKRDRTFWTPKNGGEIVANMGWFRPELLAIDPTAERISDEQ